MPQKNLGFGERFKLDQAYSPTLAQANYTPGMLDLPIASQATPASVPGAMQPAYQPQPSQLDVGLAQQQNPGSMMGMGNNMQQFTGAQQSGPTQGQMQQLGQMGQGLLAQATQQPEAPVPQMNPGIGVTGRNDALQQLLARYGIQHGLMGVE